jgi:tripartite-type tricarboxylate transporter receptor subunit TctC
VSAISRRECLLRLAAGAVPLLGGGAAAIRAARADGTTDGPCARLRGSTIAWIVPNSAGGGYDAYSRLTAPFLARALAADVAVRNVPGAGGLVGARTIIESRPDGRTIGIINASGLLAASLAREKGTPDPATAFTLLARIVGSRQIWATGGTSPHETIEDVFAAARARPIVFGTRDVGSLGFANMVLASHVLGLEIEIVAGYEGSGAGALGAARGEVDLVAYNFDSVAGHIESGDIRPLLQISDARVSPHASLDRVPLLGGPDGAAARRARGAGRSIDEAIADATTVGDLMNAGRLVVGPRAIEPALSACLERTIVATLEDPALRAAADRANLSLDVAGGAEARRTLLALAPRLEKFVPIIERAVRRLRG